jgi:GAF domain-containing protein
MEGEKPGFLEDLGRGVVLGILVSLILAGVALVWSLGVIGGILIVLIIGALGVALWRRLPRRIAVWREERGFNKAAPYITRELLSYVAHLRDVNRTSWRALEEDPDKIRARIRRDVLEPIRGFLTTPPGGAIKVVWFRPEPGGTHLAMYEQVGHTPEGQEALRLKVGGSMAGTAFVDQEPVASGNCEEEAAFQEVEKSKATGSLACVPIMRGVRVTGVLSVLATWDDAFWFSEIVYFEALAGAIAALETLEEDEASSPEQPQ